MRLFNKKLRANRKTFRSLAVRAVLFLGVLLALIAIFTLGATPYRIELHEGDIALKDIFAPFDFTYYGEVDEVATEKLRGQAAKQVKPVYDFDEETRQAPTRYVDRIFEVLQSLRKESVPEGEGIAWLKREFPEIKDSHFPALLGLKNPDEFKSAVHEIIARIGSHPILTKPELESLRKEKVEEITLRDLRAKSEITAKVGDLATLENAQKDLIDVAVNERVKDDNKLRTAVSAILKSSVVSNVRKNAEEFLKRQNEVRSGIPEVLEEIDVKKDEIVLEKGEKVKKQHLMQLEEIFGKEVSKREKLGSPLSMAMILSLLLVITTATLKQYGPKVYNNNSYLLLIAIIVISLLAGARLITMSFLSSYFIPLAGASMLIAILLNENVAFLITLMLSIGCGIIVGNKLDMMIICLVGGAVGVYAVRGLRKRFQLLKAGVLVGCANFIIISSFGILRNLGLNIFLEEGGIGLINGIASSFIVMGLLPVFEYMFNITTNITLLELSDLNHPLLKELTLKAPGTYHHSLLVGNLAEAACDAIGANSLLARVGSYYHDIGKTEKAEYFGENVVDGDVTAHHDKLSPSMSSLIITSHVKDGVELAKKHNLNQAIIDFIQQHHGDTLIYYFYQRALEKVVDETQLKEEDFRYPGPRPQTKEAAIVLLADAVEASSRTLSKPTPARIEGLVRKIINNKFIDGQLDECELTLKDLNKIASSFVRILTGVFHSRVEYPEAEEKPRAKSNHKEAKKESQLKQPPPKKNNKKNA